MELWLVRHSFKAWYDRDNKPRRGILILRRVRVQGKVAHGEVIFGPNGQTWRVWELQGPPDQDPTPHISFRPEGMQGSLGGAFWREQPTAEEFFNPKSPFVYSPDFQGVEE